MIWRIVRGRGFIAFLLVLGALLYWKLHSGPPKAIAIGYVSDRDVILWNSLAQVRETVGQAHFGDRLEILRVEGAAVQVRTNAGTIGWVRDSHQVMGSDLWGKSTALIERARALPVQARGRTKTVSNVRVNPGRDGQRIFTFMRGTPVVVLERAVADAPQGPEANSQEDKTASDGDQEKPKQEDWLLVLRDTESPAKSDGAQYEGGAAQQPNPATGDAVSGGPAATQPVSAGLGAAEGPVAGWVLARFVELDLPDAVKDYASSADLHVVAWFELNRVPDGSGGEAPQYLVAGVHGEEGGPCDFTMLRVYTWSTVRKHYETAYVESDLCGRLPILVSSSAKTPEFHFADVNAGGADRAYVMNQTSVRRVKQSGSRAARSGD